MPSRRALNRLIDSQRRDRRRASAPDYRSPAVLREPAPAPLRPGDIHPLLADEPDPTPDEQRQAAYASLLSLDAPCARCGHELGFHSFTTFELPSPCGLAGCTCAHFLEAPMSFDPFSGVPTVEPTEPTDLPPGEPVPLDDPEPLEEIADEPEEVPPSTKQDAQNTLPELFSAPVGASVDDPLETLVAFPNAQPGAAQLVVDALCAPARQVAELVDRLAPVLAPPEAVRQLEQLVIRANALEVTDAASYATCSALYEELHANEKAIEEGPIGEVVGFFHRPWKAFCEFRARYAKPVAEAKKRLSDAGGAWRLAEERRAAAEARQRAEAAAAEERKRLEETAALARAQAAAAPTPEVKAQHEATAAVVEQAAASVQPVSFSGSVFNTTPATASKKTTSYEVELTDPDAFYRALVEDPTRRVAAPADLGYLKRQAQDLGPELEKRFPGVTVREKGGLAASGRR
jgi:hypothetical protein